MATAVIRGISVNGDLQEVQQPGHRAPVRARTGHASTEQKVALVRGLDEGLLPDLWNFPSAFGNSRYDAFEQLQRKLSAAGCLPLQWDGALSRNRRGSLLRLHHGITHRSIEVDVYGVDAMILAESNGLIRWFKLGTLKNAAISQLTRKIADALVGATIKL